MQLCLHKITEKKLISWKKRLCTPSRVKEILQRNGKKYTILDVEFKRSSPIDKPNVLYHTQYCIFRND